MPTRMGRDNTLFLLYYTQKGVAFIGMQHLFW